jgi:hypothetical protein
MTTTISPRPLSPRQRQLVSTIEALTIEKRFPPTLAEVAVSLGINPSRAKALADEAVRRGFLTHEPRRARSWCVVRPDDAAAG